jgi:hypothetical protein
MTLTPAQLAQQEEARNRTPVDDSGNADRDPYQQPFNDSTGEADDPPQSRAQEEVREERHEEPEIKDRRTPSDIARAEMAERFKRARIAKEGDVPFNGDPNDPEMRYGRVAAQELEPDDSGREIVGSRRDVSEDDTPSRQPAPQPKTHTLKVRGLDVVMSEAEILERAAKFTAADTYLDDAKEILAAAKGIKREQGERTAPDLHRPEGRTSTQDDDLDHSTATDSANTPDELEQAIEEIQFGDPKNAAKKIRDVVTKLSDESADKRQATRIMNNELAKSQKALKAFADANPDIAKDNAASAVVLENIYDIYRADLVKTGIDPSKLPSDKEALANWHSFARANGQNVTPIDKVFETAKSKYQAWRGGDKVAPRQETQKSAPRINVNVDRTQRREAIPSQPSRAVAARPDTIRQAPSTKSRSDVVMQMRKQRGQVVGQ